MMQRLRAFVAEDLSEEDYAVPQPRRRGEDIWFNMVLGKL